MIPWGQWLQKKIRRNSNCLRYWWMDEGWMKLRTQTHQISWSRKANGWTGRWNREHRCVSVMDLDGKMDDGGMELRARMYRLHGLMKAADG